MMIFKLKKEQFIDTVLGTRYQCTIMKDILSGLDGKIIINKAQLKNMKQERYIDIERGIKPILIISRDIQIGLHIALILSLLPILLTFKQGLLIGIGANKISDVNKGYGQLRKTD